MFTKMAHEAFMKLKQVRRRSWGGGGYHMYIGVLWGLYGDNGKENGNYSIIMGYI